MELVQIPLAGNEENILQIYRDVYADTPDRIPSLADLRWRFGGTPYKTHIWVAKEDGKIIGLRPLAIKEIQLGNGIYPALQMLDVMVHPAYQGKGIFKALMEKAWISHAVEGAVAFTFPNENSIKAYRKWKDWFLLAELPLFVRMVAPRHISESMKLIRLTCSWGSQLQRCLRNLLNQPVHVTVERITKPEYGIQKLWERCRNLYDLIIPRDLKYISWRYFERPDVCYMNYVAREGSEISGFLAARTRTMFGINLGLIVDFFVENNDRLILSALLREAATDLIKQGVDAIGLQFIGQDSLRKAILDNGFIAVPKRLLPREFLMYSRYGGQKVSGLDLASFQQRFHTWGDNDAV